MVIGEHVLDTDMEVNAVRAKAMTNVRAGGAAPTDDRLQAPRVLGLEEAISYIREDELVEVTPRHVRMRKKVLSQSARATQGRAEKSAR